ncbi:hypothetical protein MMC09_002946 [Bachmanniomyces sp. S44760]|nr:hypothetical protein [Bachmanniomyces sp. S44760]
MEATNLSELLEQLDDNIDDLEQALSPLIEGNMLDKAQKLPLLDRAKLYILMTYAMESLLFSYLRLNGINAREHLVFRELTRVKQYFEKTKRLEFGNQSQATLSLDKAATGRIVKHALARNSKATTPYFDSPSSHTSRIEEDHQNTAPAEGMNQVLPHSGQHQPRDPKIPKKKRRLDPGSSTDVVHNAS